MLLLASTSDKLNLITSAALNLDAHVSYVDLSSGLTTPGRKNTLIATAATTDISGSPAASTFRTVKTLSIRNRHASSSNDVTLIHTDGTNASEILKVTLLAGYTLYYHEGAGFWVADTRGAPITANQSLGVGAAVNALNLVVLAADVTNNNATLNTMQDVTGLSFAVIAGQTYFFRYSIDYTTAVATTGSRWSINGPSFSRLAYRSNYALSAPTESLNSGLGAYDLPSAASASTTSTTGNIACIEGFITPSANGNVIARFASEVASSAIVAKAGSLLEWVRTL